MFRGIVIATCLLVASSLSAQDWDSSLIADEHQWTFRMSVNGDSVGYSIWGIKKMGEQYFLSEQSHVPNFKEDIFCYANAETLRPDSVLITGRLSGLPIECKAHWEDNQVTGYAHMPKRPGIPAISLTQTLPNDTKMRFMSFVLSPFYKDLAVGSTFTYPQFNSMDGKIQNINAKVTGTEKLEVMGETVEALKLELSGGAAEQNMYIDPKEHRIVRISFRNIPWVYELISN